MVDMKVRFAVAPQRDVNIVEFAEALEASGFDGIWLSDLPVAPVLDPLLGLAVAAGRTRPLRLGANIVPLGRNPFLLAKELAQLDQLSDGRLLLSFVTGLGAPREREVLGLVRRWWAGEAVEHRSEHWTFTGVPPAALPVQDPLEVWLGGRGPKALDRGGRSGHGGPGGPPTPADARPAPELVQAWAAGAGREVDPEHFGMSIPYARS